MQYIAAEHAGLWKRYCIYRLENMCSNGLESETPQSIWMQLSTHSNNTFAVNIHYMILCIQLLTIK